MKPCNSRLLFLLILFGVSSLFFQWKVAPMLAPQSMLEVGQQSDIAELSHPAGVQSCVNRAMWPECKDCVPGTFGANCSEMSEEVASLRLWIENEAVRRYGQRGRGMHLYPYLETADFRQRQNFVANRLRKFKAQRVLDIGGYFSPISDFISIDEDWCPEFVWSIDPIYAGESFGMSCGKGRFVKVVKSPYTVESAWNDDIMRNTNFDAVVCVGCDVDYGPRVDQLLILPRPFHLFIEFSEAAFTSAYGQLGTYGELIEEKRWQMPMPENGTYFDKPHLKRVLRIINYSDLYQYHMPVCRNAIMTLKPVGNSSSCGKFDFEKPVPHCTRSAQECIYQVLANFSETKVDAGGLRAESHDVKMFDLDSNESLVKSCRLDSELETLMKRWPLDQQWRHGNETQLRRAYAYARYGKRRAHEASGNRVGVGEACNRLAAASVAWKMRNGYLGNDVEVPSILEIVKEHHRWMDAYYGKNRLAPMPCVRERDSDGEPCYKFPKPAENLCRGGLEQYHTLISEVEDLLPGGRNLWYHEFGIEIEFTAYRPLPSLTGFDSNAIAKSRKILLVVGANGFFRASKYLIDMYSPYFAFDRVILFEPDAERMALAEGYNATGNVHWVQGFVTVSGCDTNDMLTYLNAHFTRDDYVVLMFDVDAVVSQFATMEWGFLAQLVSQDLRLVDELYIELHMYKPQLGWVHDRHSAREQFDIMSQLRYVCGAAVHAWP
eukprot:TRINITY_DN13816_c0_g1_i7.p1 TRINITY_DN13816_c0_g1~~TRINITY_DN13816_c0_g1_i7.p1  ORF type:complete len:719 (+),score=55.22 TRINITY_DN13816_c0_g1_i7:54-2210(+)